MGVRRIGAIALAAMLASGVLAACGDDGGDDGDGVALEDVDDSGSATEDTDGSEDESDGESTDDTDVDLGAFGSEECQDLIGALTGIGGIFTGDDTEFDFGEFADAFEEIDAPEIEEDLSTLADAYRQLDEALGDVDLTDPSAFTSDEFLEASEELNTQEFTEASERVSAFIEDACGG
jgi:hypothetical protein